MRRELSDKGMAITRWRYDDKTLSAFNNTFITIYGNNNNGMIRGDGSFQCASLLGDQFVKHCDDILSLLVRRMVISIDVNHYFLTPRLLTSPLNAKGGITGGGGGGGGEGGGGEGGGNMIEKPVHSQIHVLFDPHSSQPKEVIMISYLLDSLHLSSNPSNDRVTEINDDHQTPPPSSLPPPIPVPPPPSTSSIPPSSAPPFPNLSSSNSLLNNPFPSSLSDNSPANDHLYNPNFNNNFSSPNANFNSTPNTNANINTNFNSNSNSNINSNFNNYNCNNNNMTNCNNNINQMNNNNNNNNTYTSLLNNVMDSNGKEGVSMADYESFISSDLSSTPLFNDPSIDPSDYYFINE